MQAQKQLGTPALLAAVVAAALLALAHLPQAAAHGFVADPAARTFLRNHQNCPHCSNNGGPGVASANGRLTWPATTAPACGPRELSIAGRTVRNYKPGQVIPIKVFITTQHGGRHMFRLCPSTAASHSCFKRHLLQRADGGGAYSWVSTKGGAAPGSKFSRGSLYTQGGKLPDGELYTWNYRLPAGVKCTRCVLQWTWTTANSCKIPGAPAWVRPDTGMSPCNTPGPYPEEFSTCSDISIGGSPAPQPKPHPTTKPRPGKPRPTTKPGKPRPTTRPRTPKPSRSPGGSKQPAAACTQATAQVFCAKKSRTVDRHYANVRAGCTCFHRCGPFPPASGRCAPGLAFNDATQLCDFPYAQGFRCGGRRLPRRR